VHHSIPTPLGDVLLTCEVDGFETWTASARPLPRGTERHWVGVDRVDVGLVVVDLDPPSAVDRCVGVVWTVRTADRPSGALTFTASKSIAPDEVGGPDVGQALAAVSYSARGVALTVGTDDDQALAERAGVPVPTSPPGRAARPWPPVESPLPARWRDDLPHPWEDTPPEVRRFGAQARDDGLTVRLPPVPADHRADVHVAVAWGPDRDDAAPWYAVLTSAERILTSARRE
jgi:hypothetical protein